MIYQMVYYMGTAWVNVRMETQDVDAHNIDPNQRHINLRFHRVLRTARSFDALSPFPIGHVLKHIPQWLPASHLIWALHRVKEAQPHECEILHTSLVSQRLGSAETTMPIMNPRLRIEKNGVEVKTNWR